MCNTSSAYVVLGYANVLLDDRVLSPSNLELELVEKDLPVPTEFVCEPENSF